MQGRTLWLAGVLSVLPGIARAQTIGDTIDA
jgi:hypothetical protein